MAQLGGTFDMDPQTFEEHLDTAPWYFPERIPDHLPRLPSIARREQYVRVQFVAAQTYHPRAEAGFPSNFIWSDESRAAIVRVAGKLTPRKRSSSTKEFEKVILARNSATIWIGGPNLGASWNDSAKGDCDEPEYRQLSGRAKFMNDEGKLFPRSSPRASFQFCLEQDPALVARSAKDPFVLLRDLMRIIASEWNVPLKYIERELGTIEVYSEKGSPSLDELQSQLKDLFMLRRRTELYQLMIAETRSLCEHRGQEGWPREPDNNARCPIVSAIVADFSEVERLAERNVQRIARNEKVLGDELAVEQVRQDASKGDTLTFLIYATISFRQQQRRIEGESVAQTFRRQAWSQERYSQRCLEEGEMDCWIRHSIPVRFKASSPVPRSLHVSGGMLRHIGPYVAPAASVHGPGLETRARAADVCSSTIQASAHLPSPAIPHASRSRTLSLSPATSRTVSAVAPAMASVSSLDQDMRKLRMSRYTPAAANEARAWIEAVLGEPLPSGDLLEALRDGTVLCRLVNLAVPPPGVKFKKSPMPFIQMENISHFLRACEQPPLNMPAHDRFLTVDLYEAKDPAQVLQCLGAFSRLANNLSPSKFPSTIGPKRGGALSPSATGSESGSQSTLGGGGGLGRGGFTSPTGFGRSRGTSAASQTSSSTATFNPAKPPPSTRAMSPVRTGGSGSSKTSREGGGGARSPPGAITSWSKKSDEGVTSPAWNIHQYGYMGGANQGTQGVAFGARRQITSASPHVPSLAERERKRREAEAEAERQRAEAEEAEQRRRAEREAAEEQEKLAEERRWEEETKRHREEEKRRVEAQKQEWAEQERRWREEEEARLREEREAEERIKRETLRRDKRATSTGDSRLRGQLLSEYQAQQDKQSPPTASSKPRSRRGSRPTGEDEDAHSARIRELERQLQDAKERERQYELEREERLRHGEQRREKNRTRSRSRSHPAKPQPPQPAVERAPSPSRDSDVSWAGDEREYLRQQWSEHRTRNAGGASLGGSSRPLPDPRTAAQTPPSLPSRPLPEPTAVKSPPSPSRPLPNPQDYASSPSAHKAVVNDATTSTSTRPLPTNPNSNRADRYLSSHPAPLAPKPTSHFPSELGLTSTSERDAEDARRAAAQKQTKAQGWAAKSVVEREMEREREMQREWEERQREIREAQRDTAQGSGPGQSWDVHQYGFMGGDSQNKGGQGIGFGGRRQIIGPRPRP
ncbi:hypothetical protein BDY21DRAFT_410637 [Lineolata rhizophorae]|uniref:Calponin-homology (CH) domain-containing protein n=1 Tax=Lineolata rhizophorae TaxID=578093 RepID=A0A6A6P440_9PEZI|nr:hypothetical protein BDY21DRAFT_410637 [Lineolata rhizophorae]